MLVTTPDTGWSIVEWSNHDGCVVGCLGYSVSQNLPSATPLNPLDYHTSKVQLHGWVTNGSTSPCLHGSWETYIWFHPALNKYVYPGCSHFDDVLFEHGRLL